MHEKILTFEDCLAEGTYAAGLDRMDICIRENCERVHAVSFRSFA